jgi:hypothetical protein
VEAGGLYEQDNGNQSVILYYGLVMPVLGLSGAYPPHLSWIGTCYLDLGLGLAPSSNRSRSHCRPPGDLDSVCPQSALRERTITSDRLRNVALLFRHMRRSCCHGCCVRDPSLGIEKRQAAQLFTSWWENLTRDTVTVFLDGSKQRINGSGVVTYSYVIF